MAIIKQYMCDTCKKLINKYEPTIILTNALIDQEDLNPNDKLEIQHHHVSCIVNKIIESTISYADESADNMKAHAIMSVLSTLDETGVWNIPNEGKHDSNN
jgi:predicted transcriptional regulator YheO